MATNLTRFCVVGLHGAKTMDVRLDDGRLVLVGENGTGKSTFANLIYYFLTKQWLRLREYNFAEINAQFGDQELTLRPEHLNEHIEARQSLRALARFRHIGSRASMHLFEQLMERSVYESETNLRALAQKLAAETGMPRSMVEELVKDFSDETKRKPTRVQGLDAQISELARGQFLYLPTYRRIEQDLRAIFRGVEIEAELKKFRERLSSRAGAPFIELVEFGMEDVEQTINTRMASIKESVRNGLDNLMGTYLRDVIRGVHTAVDLQRIAEIDPQSLDAIFARIDDVTLPMQDKKRLKDKMASIMAAKSIDEADKVIAHFLLKLLEFYAEQQTREKNVRDFVDSCNQYLTGKRLVWDNNRYRIFIESAEAAEGEDPLEMKALSSGEKQIVSLFSHLYLSGQSQFFVIIDEPELSLSVPWQRRFLPDILATGMCTGLVAVTHSPFIWQNDIEPYVRSLAEFTSPYSTKPRLSRN